jgi:GAF domain-containing protein
MTDTHEEWLASTFVELADTLVADFDVVDFLTTLVTKCTDVLDGPEVGLAVADRSGKLRVLACTTERMKVLELVEVQNDEGPCRDSFHTGQQVINQRVDAMEYQWPTFIPMARTAGFLMLHAFPMRLRGKSIGAINIFDSNLREITTHEAAIVQAFADVATIGILQERSAADGAVLTERLNRALSTRFVIERAEGLVAENLKTTIDEAFSLLRGYSWRENQRLSDVARSITEGTITPVTLWDLRSGEEGGV